MVKSRDLLIIVLALIVSIGLALGTRFLLSGSGGNMKMDKILVSTEDLPVGKRLDAKNFKWQDWPADSIQTGYVTQAQKEQAKKVVGALVRNRINQGEPIMLTKLVFEDGGLLSAVVDEGMRAYTISIDRRSSISGQILPNDFVDVIIAARDQQSRGYSAHTVVENVKVLEVNSALDASEAEKEGGNKAKIKSITIQVNPEQAEDLAAALREGTPVISLHSMVATGKPPAYRNKKKEVEDTVTLIRGKDVQKVKIN